MGYLMDLNSRYIINNQEFNQFQLNNYCNERIFLSSHEWEKEIYSFILSFLNDEDTVVMCTSGSTGIPKKVVVEKEKMIISAKKTIDYFQLFPDDKVLLCLPVSYVAGKMMVVRALVGQLNLIVRKPSMTPLQELLSTDKIDFAAFVPAQLNGVEVQDLKPLKKVILGGAKVSNELRLFLQDVETEMFETYGMTETLSHVAVKSINGSKQSDFFDALVGVHFDTDERGCLRIDAKDLVDELLITNDLVELDGRYSFKWLGRIDNVINSGGMKLIPEQLELELGQVIKERFFLSGRYSEEYGEEMILVVEGKEKEMAECQNWMDRNWEKKQHPKAVLWVGEFEETSSGKVNRKATLDKNSI